MTSRCQRPTGAENARVNRSSRRLALLTALCCLSLFGCSDGRPTRVPVSGIVTIDGKPLTKGAVRVEPEGYGNPAATGDIGPDGHFTLTTFDDGDGVVLGKHPVIIVSRDVLSNTEIRWLAPKKYLQSDTSGLTLDITGPKDDAKLELTWDGKAPFIEKFEEE